MKLVHLLPVGKVENALLHELQTTIPKCLRVSCEILPAVLDPGPAYHPERLQYHSSEILQRMQSCVLPPCWRLLGVTGEDLYIPILKYVFGEAQVGGPCAVVSAHRLRQEFYGLPPDQALLRQRLLKESIHELGHALSLHHCGDYRCAMASAHAVEWIDLREAVLCENCQAQARFNSEELQRTPLSTASE